MERIIGKCPCSGYLTIHALFMRDDCCLVLEGQCLNCMERIVSSISLTALFKMAKEQRKGKPLIPPLKEQAEKPELTDKQWLKIFGIKEEE